jgi:CDGSH-type Zn-finger protein
VYLGRKAGVNPMSGSAETGSEIADLVSRLRALDGALGARITGGASSVERERLESIRKRVQRSALRPLLAESTSDLAASTPGPEVRDLQGDLWELARMGTLLHSRVSSSGAAGLAEAVSALQDLALTLSSGADRDVRRAELRAIQAKLEPGIQSLTDGPYLVTNVEALVNWLGESIEAAPLVALCRCGGSARKPFCDGSHAELGFRGNKDPGRIADRRDTYQGQQLTVLDNRGICAHSGFCTDRLPGVFHVGKEPFVTPSGARADDIARATRACPSGALGHAVDGREAEPPARGPAIEVSKDGPYRVTGAIALTVGRGEPEVRNAGASREHYSLCRCGHSRNKPFCSGMHWDVKFTDPVAAPDHRPTLFEWAGGAPALLRLTRVFYGRFVAGDPVIGPLFATMAPDHAERVAAWLGEVFGGPTSYSGRYGGYTRMISQHVGKGLTEAQRSRWVTLLCASADDAGLPADPEFRAGFVAYVEWGSRLALENSQPGARPPPEMPMPRWWWVCDATPGSRISALAPPAEQTATPVLPAAGEAVTFERHIKGLFRRMDRESMTFAFDLWSHEDVAKHAEAILRRLEAGTMPCDGAWATEKVEAFRRWVEGGKIA